jgi:hypothetical protein
MNNLANRTQMIERRGELMVELFLQDLEPAFLAEANFEVGYDFFVGFINTNGGVNTSAVVAKATEESVQNQYYLSREHYNQLAYSNIPVLFLVVNVKENKLYFAWISPQDSRNEGNGKVSIPMVEVDNQVQKSIHQRLVHACLL